LSSGPLVWGPLGLTELFAIHRSLEQKNVGDIYGKNGVGHMVKMGECEKKPWLVLDEGATKRWHHSNRHLE
jgi:hypothetical protein